MYLVSLKGHPLSRRVVETKMGGWVEYFCNKCRHEDWFIHKTGIKCKGNLSE